MVIPQYFFPLAGLIAINQRWLPDSHQRAGWLAGEIDPLESVASIRPSRGKGGQQEAKCPTCSTKRQSVLRSLGNGYSGVGSLHQLNSHHKLTVHKL
ncbi:hypothetical protein SKAU_G00222120 [Synaphobranchus kaupii]|uniref:Uncharacterized protein n=1 Tax=Synaphobranchus kaupii TaxID=118154 RepID=A0A9Q1ITY5_SYNKA|nr:hypothetical protein SKAU_G00222120 [Synaphobranchus kaupii]